MLRAHWLRTLKRALEFSSASRPRRRRVPTGTGAPVAAVVETLEDRTLLSNFTVTVAADELDAAHGGTDVDTGLSLREAILDANVTPNVDASTPDTITFNIGGGGVQTIQPLDYMPATTESVTIDGTTQPGYAGTPLIELDGSLAPIFARGVTVNSNDTTVRGLAINRFHVGIEINNGSSNVVESNFIGTDVTGTVAVGNRTQGVVVANAAVGNRIGTNGDGVDDAAERNLISGNGFDPASGSRPAGIWVRVAADTMIAGNLIGTDVTGTVALGNQNGVWIDGAVGTRLGTNGDGMADDVERNVISGNGTGTAVYLERGASQSWIAGNYIGTDITGLQPLGNIGSGLLDQGGDGTVIGTNADGVADAAERNVISGNSQGLHLRGFGNTVVAGNFIGTDKTGTAALGNGVGVQIVGDNKLVGSNLDGVLDDVERNIISGNQLGIQFRFASDNNTIAANYIGTDVTGMVGIGNGGEGIYLYGEIHDPQGSTPASNNVIDSNVISANGTDGLFVGDAVDTVVVRNLIGTAADGESPLGNGETGIFIGEAANTQIGGLGGFGNTIAFNGVSLADAGGVTLFSPATTSGATIRGNSIYSNDGLGIDLGGILVGIDRFGDGVTLNDLGDVDTGPNEFQNYPEFSLVEQSGGQAHAVGSLNSIADTSFTIDFYAAPGVDANGFAEGQRWLGSTVVVTDGFGNATFDVLVDSLNVGEVLTATATNDVTLSTSEFTPVAVGVNRPLTGRVFKDQNNDGLFNGADAGLAGVPVELFDETDLLNPIATELTDVDGNYVFDLTLAPGSYRIVETQPAGLLDGKETAGTLGGTVDNSQDSNQITGITVATTGEGGTGYDFAEIEPAEAVGLVWQDFNNDGEVNFGEKAIEGVTINLTGTDDRGNAVALSTETDVDGIYLFFDLRPGTYQISEVQPAGFDDGIDALGTINGSPAGDGSVNDVFSALVLTPGAVVENYNFGERPPAGAEVTSGQTATIGFWQNNNGQALIEALNGGPESTQLGDWLAATFSNMYGVNAGDNNLTGKTNTQVAEFYSDLFRRKKKEAEQLGLGGPVKLDAQILAVALAAYVTSETLAGTTAAGYGFLVTENGVGVSTFNVGSTGSAFGVDDDSDVAVLDLLLAVNDRTVNGVLYDQDGDDDANDELETLLRTLANSVFAAINESGDLS